MDAFRSLFFDAPSPAAFESAYSFNPKLFLSLLFFLREERQMRLIFQQGIVFVVERHPEVLRSVVSGGGSWKDLVVISTGPISPANRSTICKLFVEQLRLDLIALRERKQVSTAAKWFPSEGSVYGKSWMAVEARSMLGVNEAGMRKKYLSPLRNYLGIVEAKMSAGKWSRIVESTVPRTAFQRYSCSFQRRGLVVAQRKFTSRKLLEIMNHVLSGNLEALACWKRVVGLSTATGLAVLCDFSVAEIEVPIAAALALYQKNKLYTFGSSIVPITFHSTVLKEQIDVLFDIEANGTADETTIKAVGEEAILVITWKALPEALKLEGGSSGKKLIWWRSAPITDIKRWNSTVVEVMGFSDNILEMIIKGYTLDLTPIVISALSNYYALPYGRATAKSSQ